MRMKKRIILIKLQVVILFLLLTISTISVKAANPFVTKTVNRFDELVETQDAYEPMIKIKKIQTTSDMFTFNNPSDLFIDNEDYLYIVDSNNKRIIILDSNYEYVTDFGSDNLILPLGIFVRDNTIYITDYGDVNDRSSGKIAIYNFNKTTKVVTLEKNYSSPTSRVLEIEDFIYRPMKISVDQNLTMYVVNEGSYNGILTINKDNHFMTYFAPNNVTTTLKQQITNLLYGENERVNLTDILPAPPYNVYLDDTGYIYTVTQTVIRNELGDTLKKVNIGGLNFYPSSMLASQEFVSVATGNVENVYALTNSGFIYEYDNEGNILFVFGGTSTNIDQLGLFKKTSGIAINSKQQLIILDANDNSLQVFKPTNFVNIVHEALGYYNEGKYQESRLLWEQVLVYNSMFDLAHKGIGFALYLEADYEEALKEFELANAKEEYSDVFWEIRNIWISNNIGWLIGAIILIIGLIMLIIYLRKRTKLFNNITQKIGTYKEKRYVNEFLLMFGMIRHPSDTVYYMKTNKKLRYYNGLIILLLLFVIYIISLIATGFIFNNIVVEKTILLKEAFKIIIPIILFVIANYLASSLLEGEGTFKGIFLTTMGCLIPIIIIFPILIVLSNVLTYNESFIYYFGLVIMVGWSVVLLLFANKELHNYTLKRMILNLILTISIMLVLLIAIILCYLMISQVVEFVSNLVKEVIFRD